MQQNAKHSRPNVLPQPELSEHNVLIPMENQIGVSEGFPLSDITRNSLKLLKWSDPLTNEEITNVICYLLCSIPRFPGFIALLNILLLRTMIADEWYILTI